MIYITPTSGLEPKTKKKWQSFAIQNNHLCIQTQEHIHKELLSITFLLHLFGPQLFSPGRPEFLIVWMPPTADELKGNNK